MIKTSLLLKNIILSNIVRLAYPYKVTFALTWRCNLRCRICSIWKKDRSCDELKASEIERIFKSLSGISWLDLTGGELTVREDILEVVNIILSSAPRLKIFHLSSNGQEPGIIFALAKNVLRAGRLPVVNISLDGAQELHDELKGVPGAFQKSLEAFKLLKSLKKGRYYLSCTISDHNIGHLDDFLAFLKEAVPWVSLSDIHFNVFHKSGHYYRNSDMDGLSCPDADLFEKYILHSKKGNGVRVFFDSCYMKGLRRYIQAGSQPLGCRALKSTCFISPEGEVYPCGIFDMPLGNLRDYAFDFRRIWNSDTALIALDRIDKLHCPGCWSPCEAYPAILGNIVRSFLL